MSELLFLPTPNWFISNSLDICQLDGSCATTAINSIILTNNLFGELSTSIKDAHSKRLHGVSFHYYQEADQSFTKLIATCSEDFDIKVWNASTGDLVNQHKFHQNSPSCVDWLRVGSELSVDPLLISCDVKGNIYKWNVNTNEHVRYFPENKPITQVKSCLNKFLIAIGYKHGTIVIMDVKNDQMKILSKLKSHEDSINCLCWLPIKPETSEIEARIKSSLSVSDLSQILCSSSEDKTIRLWCTAQGVQLKCLKAPGVTSNVTTGQSASKKQGASGQLQTPAKINYTPLCWPSAQHIVSGSFKGELCAFDLLNEYSGISETSTTVKWKLFTHSQSNSELQGHKKIIYCIASFANSIITLSLDRTINTWNLDTFKQESSLTTLNGYVYSIASSPIDPNLLAVSVGDMSIKLIHDRPSTSGVKSANNNIKSEVTQICWHPTKDSIIAFGTKDGKVGIIDVISNKPAQYVFSNYNQSVYTLVWCEQLVPNLSLTTDKVSSTAKTGGQASYALYSVADGKIMQHSIQFSSGNNIQPQNIQTVNFFKEVTRFMSERASPLPSTENAPLAEPELAQGLLGKKNMFEQANGLTEFSVLKYDEQSYFFAIGKFDGSIEVYQSLLAENKLRRLGTFFNHQKLVTIIKWNKPAYASKNNEMTLMASGSNDHNIVVVDFGSFVSELESEQFAKLDLKLFSKYKHKLSGHKERITSISWSVSNGSNVLASCSYDCTVQIWNADDGSPIANYRGHSDKLLCCIFSNKDPGLVFSGGEDYCLHRWRVDAQKFKLPPDEFNGFNGRKKGKIVKKNVQQRKQPSNDELDNEFASRKADENYTHSLQQKQPITISVDENSIDSSSISNSLENLNKINMNTVKKTITKTSCSVSPSKELKTLFIVSAHGSKSPKAKLHDCLHLFDTLFESNSLIKTQLAELKTTGKPLISLVSSLDFDLCEFEFPKDSQFLSLFGNRISTLNMLSVEQVELRKTGYDKWWIFEVWRGNLAKVVNEQLTLNQMNDLLFSLFQLAVSNPVNRTVMEGYVRQLSTREASSSSSDSVHKSVMYALCSFEIERALEIYLDHNMYQYALCVAQLRLPAKSAVLMDVLSKYASYAAYTGDYETAALGYIRLLDFENALKCLLRRNYKNDAEAELLKNNLFDKFAGFISCEKSVQF